MVIRFIVKVIWYYSIINTYKYYASYCYNNNNNIYYQVIIDNTIILHNNNTTKHHQAWPEISTLFLVAC